MILLVKLNGTFTSSTIHFCKRVGEIGPWWDIFMAAHFWQRPMKEKKTLKFAKTEQCCNCRTHFTSINGNPREDWVTVRSYPDWPKDHGIQNVDQMIKLRRLNTRNCDLLASIWWVSFVLKPIFAPDRSSHLPFSHFESGLSLTQPILRKTNLLIWGSIKYRQPPNKLA